MQNAEINKSAEMSDEMKENVILDKTMDFAVRVVNLHKYMTNDKNEHTLSKQLLRSGTSIGANVHEAHNGQTKREFLSKMYIAFKEASETEYWINLLIRTEYLSKEQGDSILNDCIEIKKILTSIIKTTKEQLK